MHAPIADVAGMVLRVALQLAAPRAFAVAAGDALCARNLIAAREASAERLAPSYSTPEVVIWVYRRPTAWALNIFVLYDPGEPVLKSTSILLKRFFPLKVNFNNSNDRSRIGYEGRTFEGMACYVQPQLPNPSPATARRENHIPAASTSACTSPASQSSLGRDSTTSPRPCIVTKGVSLGTGCLQVGHPYTSEFLCAMDPSLVT